MNMLVRPVRDNTDLHVDHMSASAAVNSRRRLRNSYRNLICLECLRIGCTSVIDRQLADVNIKCTSGQIATTATTTHDIAIRILFDVHIYTQSDSA